MVTLHDLIIPAPLERCGARDFPVLSMTMHDGIMLQSDRFKKSLASIDQSAYKVIHRDQLVVGFPIDEGVLYIQKVADVGIMSPAYDVWNVDQERVDLDFLELCLHSPQSMNYYKTNLRGTTARRRSLPKDVLLSLPVKLPNLQAQKLIVNTIKKVKKTILLRKQELSALDNLIKARFVEMFGDGLEHKRLEEYTTLITKGASPKWQGIEYCDEGTLFVTSENVREGFVDLSKRKYLPDDINKILPRSVLRKNDILINIVGASIGRAAVYESDELANINQAVALIRLIPNAINKDFLLAFLNGEEAQKAYIAMKKGGARDNLSLKNIADLQIPVATVERQNEFATFVAQVDKSKDAVKKSLAETQLLLDSLMQQFFG